MAHYLFFRNCPARSLKRVAGDANIAFAYSRERTMFVRSRFSLLSYKARRKATISAFSWVVKFTSEIKLKNSTVSSSVSKRPSCM